MSIKDKLMTIAENMSKVYDAGVSQGKQDEYDSFWDIYQKNGTRTNYSFAFAGEGWDADTFKPKYDIIPITAKYIFAVSLRGLDLEQIFKDLGITFDTSGVTALDGFEYLCRDTSPSVLPIISTIGASRLRYTFYNANRLVTIRKLILKDDGSQTFTNVFPNCPLLENLIIEGTIGQNGFDISGSPKLSKESITSIINALSATTNGLTVTLSNTAVNKAFETSTGVNDGANSEEWTTLKATKSNWTISLA